MNRDEPTDDPDREPAAADESADSDAKPRSTDARAVSRRIRGALPVDTRDRPWLVLAVLPGVVAVAIYLATNAYPAHGAGLYAQIAVELLANGYALPVRIPGYTATGVPFAYPPLQFYVFAVLLDLGADPIAVSRLLPGFAVVAASVPLYLLGRDIADSRPAGAAAAGLVALNPQVLEWHVSAGGVVRAFGFLYAVVAIYAGYHVFTRTNREEALPWRMIAFGAVAFGVTVLTHPVYALFVVVSYLVLWGTLHRTPRGLLSGLAVGLGGALLAAPWLWWVVATHGPGVFAVAAGTHGGIGGGADALRGSLSPGLVLAVPAVLYYLSRRSVFLPTWLVAAELLFRQPRFAYTVASLLVPAAVAAFARARAVGSTAIGFGPRRARDRRAAGAVILILLGTVAGGAYFAHETTSPSDPSTPEYLDDDAVAATEWVASETDADATFVVLGDAAEWFPALSDRTILVGPWGVEWESGDAYQRQVTAYETVSRCESVACVEDVAAGVAGDPSHIYVPKDRYTVRGELATNSGTLVRSFERADGWERVYENDGVVIYEAVGDTDPR
jgi:hypothetical protein